MLYRHYTEVPAQAMEPYTFFSFAGDPRLYSRDDGSFFLHPESMEALQKTRVRLGKPIRLNSGHRSPIYNASVGGDPLSMHLKIAFDVSTEGHDRWELLIAAMSAGFRGVGYYKSFLHLDMGRKRHWYGSTEAKKIWRNMPQLALKVTDFTIVKP